MIILQLCRVKNKQAAILTGTGNHLVGLVGWLHTMLHTEMVYLSTDGHPNKCYNTLGFPSEYESEYESNLTYVYSVLYRVMGRLGLSSKG